PPMDSMSGAIIVSRTATPSSCTRDDWLASWSIVYVVYFTLMGW
ncbi:MAG: hypothetical protein QG586_789, partial [Pseudomonadota bacterium]|nr:hypothetical protein [Pseudomonadota bacterium]